MNLSTNSKLGNIEWFSGKVHINSIGYRGRALFATSDISAGEILIQESPLACVPLESSTSSTISLQYGRYAANSIEDSLMKYAAAQGFQGVGRTSMLAARCLIAVASLPSQRQLWWDSLVYHEPSSSARNESILASAGILERLLQFCAPTLASRLTISDLRIALLKIAANAFTITTEDLQECGHALYMKVSTINHSCEPNCLQWFDTEGNVTIRSLTNIRLGEEITISYLDVTRPTWWRQAELLSYGFLCDCPRCCRAESDEGYRCMTVSCPGIMRYKERTNTKYLYKLWLSGRVPVFPSIEEHQQAAEKLPLPLPLGHILQSCCNNKRSPVERKAMSLYCSECTATISLCDIMNNKLIAFQQQYNSIRDKIKDNLSEAKFAISVFQAANEILQLSRPLLPVTHPSFLECQSLLMRAYEGLFKFHIKPSRVDSWLQIFTEYVELASMYHKYNKRLFPGIHPIPLLDELKHLEICIDVVQSIILAEIQHHSLSCKKNSQGGYDPDRSSRLILSMFRTYDRKYAAMKSQLSLCFSNSHDYVNRLELANQICVGLVFQLSKLLNS